MTSILSAFLLTAMLLATNAFAEVINFDSDKVDTLPAGWIAGVTGNGSPNWLVKSDPTAPSPPNVLMQLGQGKYPYCVKKDVSLTNGFVEVKFKPISGNEDQAGGVIWRWKDGDNYYVARANALEDNVTLFYTKNGVRRELKSANVKVPTNQWETLRVEFSGDEIKVFLNGKNYIVMNDSHITGEGGIGVWTKADSVTAFDDFNYGSQKAP